MEEAGIDVNANIRVNTDSTVPNNDNDESINVEFIITLQKVDTISNAV